MQCKKKLNGCPAACYQSSSLKLYFTTLSFLYLRKRGECQYKRPSTLFWEGEESPSGLTLSSTFAAHEKAHSSKWSHSQSYSPDGQRRSPPLKQNHTRRNIKRLFEKNRRAQPALEDPIILQKQFGEHSRALSTARPSLKTGFVRPDAALETP